MAKKKGDGKLELTEDDYRKIETMAGYGLNIEKIAPFFGRSARSFRVYRETDERLEAALAVGKSKSHLNVAKTAYDLAVSGKCPQMTIFWLKSRAGWKENDPVIELNNTVNVENSGIDKLVSTIAGLLDKTREVKEVQPIMLKAVKDEGEVG